MNHSPMQQMAELLIQKSICGLDSQEQQQLDRLKSDHKVSDTDLQNEIDRIELAAAAADLACFQNDTDTMPNHLKDCVLVEAGKFFESQTSVSSTSDPSTDTYVTQRSQSNSTGGNGWMMVAIASMAACILLLINALGWLDSPPAPRIAMQQLIDMTPVGLTNVAMLPGPDATGQNIIESRLVWSNRRQEGYMKFSGLKSNDPSVEQYQLWLFEDLGQEFPKDGGVFDIGGDGEVVKIDAKLLAKAKYFVITVEEPGGVVVSDRSRIASVDEEFAKALAAADAEANTDGAQK